MAMVDASRLSEGGAAPKATVNPVSKAPTSGAISNQFKPYVTPAPTTSSAFVGPTVPKAYGTNNTPAYQPATATSVASTTPKVTNQSVASPSPSNLPSPQIVNKPAPAAKPVVPPVKQASTTATSDMPNVVLKKPKPEQKLVIGDLSTPNKLKPTPSAGATVMSNPVKPGDTSLDLGKMGGELLFGTESFKGAAKDIGAIFTGKDEFGNKKNRAESFAEGLGNTTMGAFNALTTASLVVPFLGEGAKGANLAVNAAVRGGKLAAQRGAAGAAAATMAVSPITTAANAGKAGTAIVQSVDAAKAANAAKNATKTFTPKITKDAASTIKNVDSVASKAKTGVTGNTGAQVVAGTGAAGKAAAAASAAQAAKTKVSVTNDSQVKAPDSVKGGEAVVNPNVGAQFKGGEAAASVDNAKTGDTANDGTTTNTKTNTENTTNTNADDVVNSNFNFNDINRYGYGVVNTRVEDGKIDQVKSENVPPREETPKTPPRKLPKIVPLPNGDSKAKEEMKRKRRWVPSAIV